MDPDLVWGGGEGGAVLPCWHVSLLSFLLFLPKIRGVAIPRVPPLDPPLDTVFLSAQLALITTQQLITIILCYIQENMLNTQKMYCSNNKLNFEVQHQFHFTSTSPVSFYEVLPVLFNFCDFYLNYFLEIPWETVFGVTSCCYLDR